MITEAWVITTLLALVAVLFSVLVLMLGWLGNKVYSRLGSLATTLHRVESDVHGRISQLDRRVTRVETKCNITPVPDHVP